jgi:hypothetical protein
MITVCECQLHQINLQFASHSMAPRYSIVIAGRLHSAQTCVVPFILDSEHLRESSNKLQQLFDLRLCALRKLLTVVPCFLRPVD